MRAPAVLAAVITCAVACGVTDDDEEYVDCVHVTTPDVFRKDTDVLPVGRCRPSKEVCELTVREPCPCEVQVPRTFYACRCQDEQWACELTSMDSGSCPVGSPLCHPGDSGTSD